MQLIATHPTQGALYQDEDGQFYHVAPDGTQTAIELEEDNETAFSEIGTAIFEHVDEDDDNENYNASWETYQAVKAERAKRDAWAMGE